MKNPINIVCATDDKYVPYCGVMLTSVFENNKDREVTAYIMIDKPLQPSNQRKFAKLAKKYHQSIQYCVVDRSFFDKYPIQGSGVDHLSIVTYYRLYAQDILPEEVKHVLYLDCDIIANGSLAPLFDQDWTDIAIGGASDMCVEWQEFYDRLGYDKSLGYFNAGVAFMNLEYWRKHNVRQQCMEYLSANYPKLLNNDQDVLNYVLRAQKRTLSVTYNYQIQLRMAYFFDGFSDEMKKEVLEASLNPTIIHYAAELKPWMSKYYSYPFYSLWQYYKRRSPWWFICDLLPKTRKLQMFVKRHFLWPLGIKIIKLDMN